MLQHPVPDKLLTRIGDVTVSFALLEGIIHTLIGYLVGGSQHLGIVLLNYVAFRNLPAAAKAVYKVRYGEDANYSELETLMSGLDSINTRRNAITHSTWGAGNGPNSISRIKSKVHINRGLEFDFEQMAESNFKDFTNDMLTLADEIQLFYIKLLEKESGVNLTEDIE
jgi:hypothetical protein